MMFRENDVSDPSASGLGCGGNAVVTHQPINALEGDPVGIGIAKCRTCCLSRVGESV